MTARLRLSILGPILLALLLPAMAFAADGGGDRPVRVWTEDGRSRVVFDDDEFWEALEELEDLDIDSIVEDALSGLDDLDFDFDFDPDMRVYDGDGDWQYWGDMDREWTRDFERQMERLGERISRQVNRSVHRSGRWDHGDDYDRYDLDELEELAEERDELRDELRELRREMRELERELESLRDRDDG